jgi:hypothetical protein
MKVKDFTVKLIERKDVKSFIETWHYSKSINGVKSTYCFGLFYNQQLIGAIIYGTLGMANAWKKYSDNEKDVLELRRLCCIDDTPKNTESFFIGKTLKWLKKNTSIKHVVSYADCNQGHEGTIYKATNFKFLGKTSEGKVILRLNDGKQFHDKTIRTKYKGELKPFAAKLKKDLEEGNAKYIKTVGKNIYYMRLTKK